MQNMMDWVDKDQLESLHKSSGELLNMMNKSGLKRLLAYEKLQPFTHSLLTTTKTFVNSMHNGEGFPTEAKSGFETCEKVLSLTLQGSEMMGMLVNQAIREDS